MRIATEPGAELPELTLDGDRLRLRAFRPDDLQLIEEAASDPFIPTITTVPAASSTAEGKAFIERQIQRRISGVGWSLAIVDEETDRAVGQIGLWVGNLHKGRAEIGYWIAPSDRGSDTAGRALGLLSDWTFEHLDVSRLSLFIEPWNTASIRTAESADYRREGLLAAWERVGGVSKDMLAFARLAPARADPPQE